MSAAAGSGASYSISIHGVDVPLVCSDASVDLSKVVACKPLSEWARSLDPALTVKEVVVQSVDMFGPRVGFIKFNAHIEYHGRRMPGVVFMRGGGE